MRFFYIRDISQKAWEFRVRRHDNQFETLSVQYIWKQLVRKESIIKQAILEGWEEEEVYEYDSDAPDRERRQPGEQLMRMPTIKFVTLVVEGVPQV